MSKLAALGLLVTLLASMQPARAVPHVYTDTGLGVSDLTACIDNAKQVARKHGFNDDIQVLGSGESRILDANHASKPLALALASSCSTRLGAASIAVAGMNNDDAFQAFQQVCDNF
jgi:hypothetical protein